MKAKNVIGEYLTYPNLFVKFLQYDKRIPVEKYKFDENKSQYILYFEPEKNEKKYVIIYIHGGGWRSGNPNIFRYIGNSFAKEGFHTISIGYKLSPKYKYPSQTHDIFLGFDKALSVLRDKNIDVSNIIVVGSSAGGHLGALLVYNKVFQESYKIDRNIFKGFISLGGALHLEVCKNKLISSMLDSLFLKNYDRKNADPYYFIDGDENTRVLCLHSNNDPICEKENSITFTDKINSFNESLSKCIILKDENIFHSNLVNGIFFENMDSSLILKELFDWISEI